MKLEEIGYFSKTHGLKGQLQLNVTKDFDIENCEALMIVLPSGQSPQFLADFRETKNGFIVSLEELDSIEKVKTFVGKKVMVDDSLVFEEVDTFKGYRLIDSKHGDIGMIDEVEDTGVNLILNISYKGKQILLPFNEDLVSKIDDSTKTIYYNSPDGLIDMYLA
jgi:16S rRNA processing protein RimM